MNNLWPIYGTFGVSDHEDVYAYLYYKKNKIKMLKYISLWNPEYSNKLIFLFQERVSLIVPWIVGLITFMALEAVAIVYSNVLRDHVNKVSYEHELVYT